MKERLEMLEDIEDVLFTERQIAVMVERIGQEISRDYKGKNLLLISVFKRLCGVHGGFDAVDFHPGPH